MTKKKEAFKENLDCQAEQRSNATHVLRAQYSDGFWFGLIFGVIFGAVGYMIGHTFDA